MKLVDMKMPKRDPEKEVAPSIATDAPQYPWGLSLHLDDDCLKKLGIEKLPDAGDELQLQAVVKVESVEQSDMAGGKKRRSMRLQITKCALGEEKPNAADQAKVIFDGK